MEHQQNVNKSAEVIQRLGKIHANFRMTHHKARIIDEHILIIQGNSL